MSKPKTDGRNLGQGARMVMHEDEHAIVEQILSKTLGEDDCFAKVVSRDRSESGRAEDRLGLARFLDALFRVLYDTPAIIRADGALVRATCGGAQGGLRDIER